MKEELVNEIIEVLKDILYAGIIEEPNKLPIINQTLILINLIPNYSLKDMDDYLFNNLIKEVVMYLNR